VSSEIISITKKVSISPVLLKSDRLSMEPVSLFGLDDFHEYSMCKDLYDHFEFSAFNDLEESREYLNKLIHRSKSDSQQYWFIKESHSKKVIGSFGVHTLDEYRMSVEIGYALSPHYWGRGYFSEALNTMLDYIYLNLNLHRVVAKTANLNKASINGLERAGFEQEGLMKDYYKNIDGTWFDAVLLAKINRK